MCVDVCDIFAHTHTHSLTRTHTYTEAKGIQAQAQLLVREAVPEAAEACTQN
jgi:hypothetical protein